MARQPNIILLVLDTARKDALSIYGNKANTPYLDAFAADAVVFNNCIAPAPWTIPSHASFFTGKYPSEHGIDVTKEAKCLALKRAMNQVSTETLPEFMSRKASYNTVGFSANYFVCPGSGFDRGFDIFNYRDVRGIEDNEMEIIDGELKNHEQGRKQIAWDLIKQGQIRNLAQLYLTYSRIKRRQKKLHYPLTKGGNEIVQRIKEADLRDPFFLFANLMELHEPYEKYEMDNWSFSLEDLFGLKEIPPFVLERIKQRYYLVAGQLDSFFGRFIQELREKRLYDDSVIVVVSDHGQAFKEKNYYGHGLFLHDEIIQVPLMIKFPNNRKFQVKNGYQSLVDLPKLIHEVIEEGNVTNDTLTRDRAFSESFGIHYQFIPKGSGREIHDVQRKAIFKDGYKLVLNLSNEAIEEFSYRGKPIEQNLMTSKKESLIEELRASMQYTPEKREFVNPFAKEEELVILENLHALGYS